MEFAASSGSFKAKRCKCDINLKNAISTYVKGKVVIGETHEGGEAWFIQSRGHDSSPGHILLCQTGHPVVFETVAVVP